MYNEKYKGHKINIEKEKLCQKDDKNYCCFGRRCGFGRCCFAAKLLCTNHVTDSTNVTAQAVVGEAISVTADAADDTVKIEGVTANQDVKEGSTVLTIQTNNTSGYNVNIKDADAVTALTTDGTDTTNGIPASATLTKGSKGWGFKASTTTTGVLLFLVLVRFIVPLRLLRLHLLLVVRVPAMLMVIRLP